VSEYAVTAIGRDRPGIVAAISGALLELDGNIEDSQMSILGGHFAVMLIVEVADSVTPDRLEERLREVGEQLDLEAIAVSAVDPVAAERSRPSHVVTVYGADHPGIVHSVTSALAERGVNVTDMETRLAGAPQSPLYAMIIEVDLGEAPEAEVDAALRTVAETAAVEVNIRPLDAEAL
jgi:glycine cleavage system transcriptional repressor